MILQLLDTLLLFSAFLTLSFVTLTYFMINFKVLQFLLLEQYCLIIYLTLYDPPLKCVMPFFNKIFIILVIHNKKLSITEMERTYLRDVRFIERV